ncbi:hypothetical protein N2603_28695 [Bradyrhizobium huanghuaihaiense]|uniref:hypothetical protein n=1 Tax=Bradyrhizobium huanghuaihaiense TaxID=990078 RepID=UPI0021AAA472|nr:hypothetical protein [Bradyrhizobium sp. CB3035]UWU74028.1 hypothetical protein N2603_28695 [Bradyrhizobium sp. CB3035]
MRPLTGIVCSVALCAVIDAAAAQDTRPPAGQSGLGELVKIDSFQTTRRADNYGIASFVLSNGTDKKIDSVELTCWMDDDRERATKVLVWANQPVPARASYQFKNVNIGVVGPNSRSQCEVTRVD